MSISIEALAMAGTDHIEWGMSFAEWERMDIGPPPPYLYDDEDCDFEQQHHEEDKEVVELKQIDSSYHSQDVLIKGIEMAIMIAGINPKKLVVDDEIQMVDDEIQMQERLRCV
ncbi:unnamed protein product [Lactuca virosa]|uniref:1-phosphatidylinositol 4-kinase n=1 Tax=Lactuca virosa TaxID=75947 RepID=A0AAU9NGB8_9ASTR|nr:unnamed protein product [Lactuca virosa]